MEEKNNEIADYIEMIQDSKSATLMIIPYGVRFRFRVDEIRLPEVSCVYKIESGSESFEALIKELKRGITGYGGEPSKLSEVRIGIVFETMSDAVNALYFEDWGRNREIRGVGNGHELSASSDLPEKLRALAVFQGATLVSNMRFNCSHT